MLLVATSPWLVYVVDSMSSIEGVRNTIHHYFLLQNIYLQYNSTSNVFCTSTVRVCTNTLVLVLGLAGCSVVAIGNYGLKWDITSSSSRSLLQFSLGGVADIPGACITMDIAMSLFVGGEGGSSCCDDNINNSNNNNSNSIPLLATKLNTCSIFYFLFELTHFLPNFQCRVLCVAILLLLLFVVEMK